MPAMERYFVTFYSPGSLVAEETTKPISSWNTAEAIALARDIVERHNAKPYGFRFSTRRREADDLDSRVPETSGMYYLGGEVLTLHQIKARGNVFHRVAHLRAFPVVTFAVPAAAASNGWAVTPRARSMPP